MWLVFFPPCVFQVQSSSAKMGPPRRKAKLRGGMISVNKSAHLKKLSLCRKANTQSKANSDLNLRTVNLKEL